MPPGLGDDVNRLEQDSRSANDTAAQLFLRPVKNGRQNRVERVGRHVKVQLWSLPLSRYTGDYG